MPYVNIKVTDEGVSAEQKRLLIKGVTELLERVLKKTLFSFSTNKRIFNSILILQKMKGMRSSLKLYARHSRFDIAEENRQHYRELAHEAAQEFLRRPNAAACLQMDPAGLSRLDYAKSLRRQIRRMVLRARMTEAEAGKLVALTKDTLAMALYRPEMPLPGVGDVL